MSEPSFPAFPLNEKNDDGSHHHSHPGMSLRDHFAGLALTAIIPARVGPWRGSAQEMTKDDVCVALAAVSYAMADAMLKVRGL